MVEKMKYISITGHIANMNHVVSRYISRYDIQLEAAPHYPGQMEPFATINPYTATLQKAEDFLQMLGPAPDVYVPMTGAEAVNLIEAAHMAYEQRGDRLRQLEDERMFIAAYIHRLQPFENFDAPIAHVESMSNVHHRFGRMPIDHFRQYETFLHDDERILLHICKRGKEVIWVVYFTPCTHKDEVDAVFASLSFEAIPLALAANGNLLDANATFPSALLKYWHGRQVALEMEILALTQQSLEDAVGNKDKICIACEKVRALHAAFDVKKHAALSKGRRIFTFVGWMAEKDAKSLEAEIDSDELTVFTRYGETADSPPISLRNPPIIRQFEFFTRLYGLPAYDEIDPTPLLAMTYTLLFGLMFGDVGHGLVLAVIGMYMLHALDRPLGGILTVVGVSSVVFGFLYGSIFGFEDILPALWRRPMADITGTLLFAVYVGVGLIVLSMCLHMHNAAKARRFGDLLFGANGVAGLLFYGAVLMLAYRALFGGYRLTTPVVLLAVLPLVFVALKRPIVGFIEKDIKKSTENQRLGMMVFNTIIELFETLLTYATNTISFVRVGAFAISHAGMMHVVLQLSQGAAGSHNLLILILGNVLVMAIEGLLVGIQVLRLDFYEIFSRFYTGGGRGFTSNRIRRF
ncbi:MAG: hypothetical protein FWC92_01950 [Defluviitaleaceae bacterium]|nr:hypothetical protein [Defluviitaleaceae bacterium]